MAWLSDWAYRIEITIDDTNVDSNATNFPHLIYISASSGPGTDDVSSVFDELTSDANRKKIAVTTSDGTTQCYVEIEKWDDANEQAWLWVKVPSILASGGATLYLYYDSSKSDNTSYVGDITSTPGQAVWSNSYEFVCHMAQDPNGDASNALKDSTGNAIHATPSGTMTTADLVDGLVGKAIDFDGSDDLLLTAEADDELNIIDTLTVEVCFNANYTLDSSLPIDGAALLSRQHQPNSAQDSYAFLINTSGKLLLGSYGGNIQSTTASWTLSTWYYVAGTFDDNSSSPIGDLFKDGVKETLSVDNFDTMAGATNSLAIADNDSGATNNFPGKIDEVRISSVVRTDAWIKTTNHSIRDNMNSFGSEVAYSGNYSVDLTEALGCTLGFDTGLALTEKVNLASALSCTTELIATKARFHVGLASTPLPFTLSLDAGLAVALIGRDLWEFNSVITKIFDEDSPITKTVSEQSRITKNFDADSSVR